MRNFARLFMVITAGFLSGCATLSKEECEVANWETIGFEDGSKGYASNRVSNHREACAEYGVAPNLEKYLAGHKRGIRLYCVPGKGFELGRSGTAYDGICPGDLEQSFLASYRQGFKVHELEVELYHLKKERKQLMEEHDELIEEIENNEKMIISDNTSSKLREELLEQNKLIDQILSNKDAEISDLKDHIDSKKNAVDKLIRKWR